MLLPMDDSTKEWFTTAKLTLDPTRTDTCQW